LLRLFSLAQKLPPMSRNNTFYWSSSRKSFINPHWLDPVELGVGRSILVLSFQANVYVSRECPLLEQTYQGCQRQSESAMHARCPVRRYHQAVVGLCQEQRDRPLPPTWCSCGQMAMAMVNFQVPRPQASGVGDSSRRRRRSDGALRLPAHHSVSP